MYKIDVNRIFIRRYTKGQRKKKAADAAFFLGSFLGLIPTLL